MTFVHGNGTRVLVNEREVSTTIAGWSAQHSRGVSEVSCLPDTGAKFVPGLMTGSLALRGPSDTAGQNLHTEINAAIGTDNALLATLCPDTTAIGKPAIIVLGDVSEYAIDAVAADAVGYTMTAMPDESVDMGFLAHGLTAETATANGTAVDRGVGSTSTRGGVASLHVTSYATMTSVTVKIQHSTDNSVWADLVSFTAATGVTSQRVSVVTGTTVNRYVRVVTTVVGAGSATYLVAFAPR